MAAREVLLYPHPLLREICRPVGPADGDIAPLLRDLVDTMQSGPRCVGVAAPQIGEAVRICVVDVSTGRQAQENNHGLLVMVNPEIVERSGSTTVREGCLSVPDYTGDLERATRVVVAFVDAAGTHCRVDADGFEAVAIQHEVDHLDGLLFLDRIVSLKTGLFRRRAGR